MLQTEKNLIIKSPVVVVLGHVDHGKSTLIEKIKDIKITEKESGGITQHIGAYEVTVQPKGKEILRSTQDDFVPGGHKITFIDTPGHETFSAMRIRGAKVADIAVLVIDAVEGVRAQTKEAIETCKKAQIPIIVALNKIDRPQADKEKVKRELSDAGVLVESQGGKVPVVETSGKTGQGIEELLETILLLGEVENLKADISGIAEGTIIESLLDSQKGPVATLILEKGILRENDILGTSSTFGKSKKLTDFQGKLIKEAFPSQPVQVLGFEEVPKVGEKFKVFSDFEAAKGEIKKEEGKKPQVFLEAEGKKVLNIVLKADVLGSLEAIENALKSIPQTEIILRIIKSGVGNIGVSDIQLAEEARAKIFGFRVKLDRTAKFFSQQRKIYPKIFEVIYELIEEVRKDMKKLLSPEIKRIDLGKIKILVLFKKEKGKQIIGGKVIEGEITKNTQCEVLRNDEIIGKGKIKNIQQEKKDIVQAAKKKEIGILFEGGPEIQEGDILAVFKTNKTEKSL